tara:strand:+ start:1412 stop:1879 length:468 start_codon:yes stop_codon:yes gene_type:complete
MATRHVVRFRVSATPVVNVDAVDGASLDTSTVHENIRKTLGGSGKVAYNGAIDYGGVTDGSPNYLEADGLGVAVGNGDTEFIYIKHTGYAFSSSTVLGAVNLDDIQIYADSEHIANLGPNESWFIPLDGTSSTVSSFTVRRGSSTNIAIEALGLD